MSTPPVITDVLSLAPVLSYLLLTNEHNNFIEGITKVDLANFMGALGSDNVIAAYLKRIDDAISNTTFADVATSANAATAGGMGLTYVSSESIAKNTFKTYMTWYVIKKAFTSGYAALGTVTADVLSAQELEFNKRMLYVAQKGYGREWYNAIASKTFPKFNFKVAYTAAASAANGYVVSEILSSNTSYAAASFFEISLNSMTSFSAMAPVIRANNGVNVLSPNDIPSSGVYVKSAIKLALDLDDTADQSGVTATQLLTVLPLVNSSVNLLNELLTATSNAAKISKTVIGQMTDKRLLELFAKMPSDDLFAYVPTTITTLVQRSQYDASDSTKIYQYSNAVSRVVALVNLGGWSYEKLLGIYLANPGLTTETTVRTYLQDGTTGSNPTYGQYTPYTGANSSAVVQTRDVFAAYRHYLQSASFSYASLNTAEKIATWISESGISALLTTTPANTSSSSTGVNVGANKYSDILTALSSNSTDKPTPKLDDHWDAIKLLAEQVSAIKTNAAYGKSVAEIVHSWFTTSLATTDSPSGASAADFWKLPVATSIESAELKFALYVLNSGFKMLEDSSNDKWFAKLVKVGAVVSTNPQLNGVKNLYGLNGTSTVTTPVGKPVAGFGSDAQILRAVNVISVNESTFTKVKLYLTVMGAVTTFAGIETLYIVFGVDNIVNLASIPQQKDATTFLITSANDKMAKVFPNGTSDFYAGFTTNTEAHKNLVKRMTFVSKLHDLITAASGTLNAVVTSINHLKLFNATDAGDFFKYHVSYANDNVDNAANIAFRNIINIIMGQDPLKINSFITADSRAKDWSAAMIYYMQNNTAFTARSILDASDRTSASVLRPSNSLTLRSVATTVHKLLTKPLHINPNNQVAESRVILSELINGTLNTFAGKQGNIIFCWYAAISDGGIDNTKMTQDAFNNLLENGIPSADIIGAVHSRSSVSGFTVGEIAFFTFVGTDDNGNPIFDSV